MRPRLVSSVSLSLSLTALIACSSDDSPSTGSTGTAGGANVAGAAGATAGTGGASAGGGASAAGSAGTTGGDACAPACGLGFTCCHGACVNPANDILNCGTCDTKCAGAHPFCAAGSCASPPCEGASCNTTTFCCGAACCAADELCCDVPGPVAEGVKCQKPSAKGTCDLGCTQCKCNAPDTPIATPAGERAIASLRAGELVYTMHHGMMVARPIRLVHSVPAAHHVVVELTLATGRVLHVSGPHPTTDGRTFSALRAGDVLDGVRVVSAAVVPFAFDATHDILPDSDSGSYFAAGVLIGSTLGGERSTGVSLAPTSPWSF